MNEFRNPAHANLAQASPAYEVKLAYESECISICLHLKAMLLLRGMCDLVADMLNKQIGEAAD